MNKFSMRINKRRIKMGLKVEKICEIMGWVNNNLAYLRRRYYRKIENQLICWHFEDICKMLNMLECSYEELFRGHPFQDNEVYTYRMRSNITARLKHYAELRDIPLNDLRDCIGTTRQNYYANLSSKKFKLIHINKILDLLDTTFDDVFATKTFLKKVEKEEEEFAFKFR